jgi:hypothetical protein
VVREEPNDEGEAKHHADDDTDDTPFYRPHLQVGPVEELLQLVERLWRALSGDDLRSQVKNGGSGLFFLFWISVRLENAGFFVAKFGPN